AIATRARGAVHLRARRVEQTVAGRGTRSPSPNSRLALAEEGHGFRLTLPPHQRSLTLPIRQTSFGVRVLYAIPAPTMNTKDCFANRHFLVVDDEAFIRTV